MVLEPINITDSILGDISGTSAGSLGVGVGLFFAASVVVPEKSAVLVADSDSRSVLDVVIVVGFADDTAV